MTLPLTGGLAPRQLRKPFRVNVEDQHHHSSMDNMFPQFADDRLSYATADGSEELKGLCSTRAGSHDAQADTIPKTDYEYDNQQDASAMGARRSHESVAHPNTGV